MAGETWSQRLWALVDPNVAQHQRAEIIAELSDLLDATAHAAPASASASGPTAPSVPAFLQRHEPPPPARGGLAGQWAVGYNATATAIPLIGRTTRQPVTLPATTRAALVGGTLTIQTGSAEGQSARILAVDAAGTATLADSLLGLTEGDYVELTAAPALTAGDSSAWLDEWVQPGTSLAVTSPWNGTVSLSVPSGVASTHVVIGYGFLGSVSGSASASDLRIGPASASRVTLSGPSSLRLELGTGAGGTVSADSSTNNATVQLGDGMQGTVTISGLVNSTATIGRDAAGNYTLGGTHMTVTVGSDDASSVSASTGADGVSLKLGNSGAGTVDIGATFSTIRIADGFSVSAHVSGDGHVLDVGQSAAGSYTLDDSSYAAMIYAGDGTALTVSVGASALTPSVFRFGPGSTATVTASASSSGTVGENQWWDQWKQAKALAAGDSYTTPGFDLSGWGGGTAVATVSAAGDWTLTATVAAVSGGPSYAVGSAAATGSATVHVTAVPPNSYVTLTVDNTSAASVTIEDLGFLLLPPGTTGGTGGASGGTASSVTIANTSGNPVPTTTSPQELGSVASGTTVTAGATILPAAVTAPAAGTVTLQLALLTASAISATVNGSDFFALAAGATISANIWDEYPLRVGKGSLIQYKASTSTTIGALAVWFAED
jgi:hypothetical protein